MGHSVGDTDNTDNIVEELNNYVSKMTPYITLHSALATVGTIFIALSYPSKVGKPATDLFMMFMSNALRLSGTILCFSAFLGITGVVIYIHTKGKPQKDFVRVLMNNCIGTSIYLPIFGFMLCFIYTLTALVAYIYFSVKTSQIENIIVILVLSVVVSIVFII